MPAQLLALNPAGKGGFSVGLPPWDFDFCFSPFFGPSPSLSSCPLAASDSYEIEFSGNLLSGIWDWSAEFSCIFLDRLFPLSSMGLDPLAPSLSFLEPLLVDAGDVNAASDLPESSVTFSKIPAGRRGCLLAVLLEWLLLRIVETCSKQCFSTISLKSR